MNLIRSAASWWNARRSPSLQRTFDEQQRNLDKERWRKNRLARGSENAPGWFNRGGIVQEVLYFLLILTVIGLRYFVFFMAALLVLTLFFGR
ncbi:hypothetical protein I5V32_03375 [Stenotrophomonas maltophilia]|uniref:hypothetical protein n=1 Tax=Stenotrophomonas TaxID=40323 RepID=UPI00128B0650|nr:MULTISPECIES: hypothetical protein [Stenotrophomonas]MBH1583030.1 hypothetical protein [Stenotrophomonas maltophilia]MBH1715192.1 hypothetical protein [Stenotrophomonas maltophilia]MCR1817189.1 hypothetical protein [Stenotrophomonas muris]MDG9972332.1 hypothetical protein [Stenotrophomonas sp. GD04032]